MVVSLKRETIVGWNKMIALSGLHGNLSMKVLSKEQCVHQK